MKTAFSQSQSRLLLVGFILFICGLTALITFGFGGRLKAEKKALGQVLPQHECIDIISGDTIVVVSEPVTNVSSFFGLKHPSLAYQKTNMVKLIGIDCPELNDGTALDRQAERLHIPRDALIRQGHTARKTLIAYIRHKRVKLTFAQPASNAASADLLHAYCEIHKVDVGKKLVEGGPSLCHG